VKILFLGFAAKEASAMISVLVWRNARARVSMIQARDLGVMACFGADATGQMRWQDLADEVLQAEARLRLEVLHCHRGVV
jgi:hypothetical protein